MPGPPPNLPMGSSGQACTGLCPEPARKQSASMPERHRHSPRICGKDADDLYSVSRPPCLFLSQNTMHRQAIVLLVLWSGRQYPAGRTGKEKRQDLISSRLFRRGIHDDLGPRQKTKQGMGSTPGKPYDHSPHPLATLEATSGVFPRERRLCAEGS